MAEICLWGNATDLSLLTSLTYDDIQKLQGSSARKAAEQNILVNDLPAAYEVLRSAKHDSTRKDRDRRVDIVLDNAGFELFVDLILAAYLLSANLATSIVLHPKSIPWFVSDVVPADFAALLNALADPRAFYRTAANDAANNDGKKAPAPLSAAETGTLAFLFNHLSNFHRSGQLFIRPNRFWTQAGSYWRLPAADGDLYEGLKASELVIFKGDLNYRKLVGDVSLPSLRPSPVLSACRRGSGRGRQGSLTRWHGTGGTGAMARHDALRDGSRTAGKRVGGADAGVEDLQGGRRGWSAGGCGREAEKGGRRDRARKGRGRGREEMGVEREVGCCAVLRWEVEGIVER